MNTSRLLMEDQTSHKSWSNREIYELFTFFILHSLIQLHSTVWCVEVKKKTFVSSSANFQIVPFIFRAKVEIRESWFWIMAWKTANNFHVKFSLLWFERENSYCRCCLTCRRWTTIGLDNSPWRDQTAIMHEILEFPRRRSNLPLFFSSVSLWSSSLCWAVQHECFKTQALRRCLYRMVEKMKYAKWTCAENEIYGRTRDTTHCWTLVCACKQKKSQIYIYYIWNWFILSYDPILPLAQLAECKRVGKVCGREF